VSEPSGLDASGNPTVPIYSILMDNAKRAMITVSIGSVIGSLLLIKVINYLSRRRFLYWSFLGLSVLVAATGISFLKTFRTPAYGVTLILYILCQFFFNLGPNSLTFIIPAEIFPTRYRCTFHGLSAAAGKLASVIVQVSLPYMKFGGVPIRDINSNGLGWVLIIFGFVLALGALPAWAWLPEIQKPRHHETGLLLPSKTLEELEGGIRQAEANGEIIGFRKRIARFQRKRRHR
jgi:PHS family inorganic phosphate transporter-like MFS transporter